MKKLNQAFIKNENTIRETMRAVSQAGIALLIDEDRHLIGTVTDGDIRRAILDGVDLDAPVTVLRKYHPWERWDPVTAPMGTAWRDLVRLMRSEEVRQVPLLNDDGRVEDLVLFSDLIDQPESSLSAVVMAGGYGTRLKPLTEDMPKPMLPVGDRPIMEHIVDQLREAGIKKVNVATHFMAESIEKHFGNGANFGVDIEYVSEDRPLGTAGALGLMEPSDQPILVINGDILTQVDFRAMLDFHYENHAEMTVGIRQYDLQVPYGVIEAEGARITRVLEKPMYALFVNAGIYLINPSAQQMIPSGKHFDMTDLIERMIVEGRAVVSFPIIEYWLDIGQHPDYEQAQDDIENRRLKH